MSVFYISAQITSLIHINSLTSKISTFRSTICCCITLDVSAALRRRLVWLESEGVYLAADQAGLGISYTQVFQRHSGEILSLWHNTKEGDIAADRKQFILRINLRRICNNTKKS